MLYKKQFKASSKSKTEPRKIYTAIKFNEKV